MDLPYNLEEFVLKKKLEIYLEIYDLSGVHFRRKA